ncbi:hypothetical protein [Oryza sativa Japonica Group]|uniref:Uncharacterized protein n=1 Tax=Oryza sativa subsp. japonica TaxID=39947 RepID=Q5N9K4_ORYSJ|nr:hypothetical protein [Oryza sativa Japonica Group]
MGKGEEAGQANPMAGDERREPANSGEGEVKGIPGSVAARGIDARGADDGGFRQRSSAASKEGKLHWGNGGSIRWSWSIYARSRAHSTG